MRKFELVEVVYWGDENCDVNDENEENEVNETK
jgi:hypothetical protein